MIDTVLPISINGQSMKKTDVMSLNVFHIFDFNSYKIKHHFRSMLNQSNTNQSDAQGSQKPGAGKKNSANRQKNQQIMEIVNSIFKANQVPQITNLSQDFADGHLFLKLFNILFDETVELRLSTDASLEARINNWNKINCVICFNYF